MVRPISPLENALVIEARDLVGRGAGADAILASARRICSRHQSRMHRLTNDAGLLDNCHQALVRLVRIVDYLRRSHDMWMPAQDVWRLLSEGKKLRDKSASVASDGKIRKTLERRFEEEGMTASVSQLFARAVLAQFGPLHVDVDKDDPPTDSDDSPASEDLEAGALEAETSASLLQGSHRVAAALDRHSSSAHLRADKLGAGAVDALQKDRLAKKEDGRRRRSQARQEPARASWLASLGAAAATAWGWRRPRPRRPHE